MGRINNTNKYLINIPTLESILIGSKEPHTGLTRNYTIEGIIDLIETIEFGEGNIISYLYSDGTDPSITPNTLGYFFSDNISPNLTTLLTFNKQTKAGDDLTYLFNILKDNTNYIKFRIERPGSPNTLTAYTVSNVTEFANYFELNVEVFETIYSVDYIDEVTYSL